MDLVDDVMAHAGVPARMRGGEPWDAAVIGAGPAGSIAALHLVRGGRRVLLLDRLAFPREKVCGDTLLEDALRCLERAGLLGEVRARAYVPVSCAVHSPAGLELRLPGRFLAIKRVALDDLLRSAAVTSGATFAVSGVRELCRDGTLYSVTLDDGSVVRARCVLVASGAHPALLGRCGFTVPKRRGVAAAIRGYLTSALQLDRMIVCYDRAVAPGYAWIFPLGAGEYNIGCGVIHDAYVGPPPDLHAILERFLRSFPLASELAARGGPMLRPKGALLRTALAGAEPVSPAGVLAVGEAIGTTLSITGEGIGKAMESAELAAESADRYLTTGRNEDLFSYREAVEARLRPTFRAYERAQAWIKHRWVVDLVCERGLRNPRYAGLIAGVLADTVEPSRVLSPHTVVGSFLH
jgi:geranylgeranyl reductase family protein